MTRYVLDASVAVKWFLSAKDETLTPQALELLRLYVAAQAQFFVPDLFYAEFTNIFWKAERLGRCDERAADAAANQILQRNLVSFPTTALLREAARIAREHDRSIYDSLYLALAVAVDGALITADEKLVNSLAGRLPVRWLGAL